MIRTVGVRIYRIVRGVFAVIGVGVILLRLFAPWPSDGFDSLLATEVGAAEAIHQTGPAGRPILLSIDGRGPLDSELTFLKSAIPQVQILPVLQRRADTESCPESDRMLTSGNRCDAARLNVEFLASPLWHVSFVRWVSDSCTGDFILVKGVAQWHVVSRPWRCWSAIHVK